MARIIVVALTVALALGTAGSASAVESNAPTKPADKSGEKAPASDSTAATATTTGPVSAPLTNPLYKLPKVGKPRRRVGGGRRGPADDLPKLFTLVPEHVGLTVAPYPTLYWYIDDNAQGDVAFELTLIDDESIQPLIDVRLARPEKPGLQAIDLADHGVELAPGQEYQWSVALVPSEATHSRAVISTGWVERVPDSDGVVARARDGGPGSAAALYAEAGLWYDALDSVCSQVVQNPADAQSRERLASLLQQVGLPEIAARP